MNITFDELSSDTRLKIGTDDDSSMIVRITGVSTSFLQADLESLNGQDVIPPVNATLVFAALPQNGPITPEMRNQVMQAAVQRIEPGLVVAMLTPGGNNLSRVSSVERA